MIDLKSPKSIRALISPLGGDITVEAAREIIADNCVIREAASLPYGGEHHGPQGFVDALRQVYAAFGGSDFSWEMQHMYADEASGTMIHYSMMSGTTPKGSFTMPVAVFYKVRDGKVVEMVPVYYDTKLLYDLTH